MPCDHWDERYEPTGWGPETDGRLLDDVLDGLDALRGYARDVDGIRWPAATDLIELLDAARGETDRVPSEDRRAEALDAIDALHAQLTAPFAAPAAA
ncbi:hypothetical protein [Parafrankia sp. FMc2]|uniref:hypothetical protein n=1 Tax=Parafrankia sp. FMc2 TaxID=3233196 RepID=UPI0034D49380